MSSSSHSPAHSPANTTPSAGGAGLAGDAGGAATGGEVRADRPPWHHRLLRDELGVVLVLVVLVGGIGIAHPGFLSTGNLLSTAQGSVYIGLMACGMVFPLAMREVDLSVGGTFALTVVAGAVMIRDGLSPWPVLVVILALAALLGAINGLITTYLHLPSFIVTLATALLYQGVALAMANGKQITGLPQDNSFFTVVGGNLAGVPTSVWVFAALAIVLTVMFTRTRFGAQVRAIGSNPDAADFAGLPIVRTRIKTLALSGLMAGAAGALQLAFYLAGDPTVGNGYALYAIAACIIGGTPLMGGRGSVAGAAVGSLILSVVTAALAFFQVPINWTNFATGAVILIAVAFDSLLRRSRDARAERRSAG